MVKYLGDVARQTMSGRKPVDDFMREAEEFESRKKQRQMQEQLAPLQMEQQQLQLEKMRQDMTSPKMPFSGTGFDAQLGNIAYEKYLAEGLDPMAAKQSAADDVLRTKMDTVMVKDPYTGQSVPVAKPRAEMFGSADYRTGGFNPDAGMLDPMMANQQAAAARAQELGFNMPDSALPSAPLMPVDMTQADVEAQLKGTPVDGQSMPQQLNIDPRALASPDVQKDLARKQGEIQLKSQDPEFLAKQKVSRSKELARQAGIERAEGNIIQDMGRSIDMLEKDMKDGITVSAGLPAFLTRKVPIGPAFDLDKMVRSVKSNISINEIMDMKQRSETGGALGQIPVQQQEYLMELRGSLDTAQNPSILLDNMKRIQNISKDMVYGTPQELDILLNGDESEIQRLAQFKAVSFNGLIDAANKLRQNPEKAAKIIERHELSFDEFGDPVQKTTPQDIMNIDIDNMSEEELDRFLAQ